MPVLKKLGVALCVIGIAGMLAPFVGVALGGLKAAESHFAGLCLAGLGITVWIIGLLIEKSQDAMQTRRHIKLREHAREPDDVVK